jgi:hypothetical protein
MTDPNAIEEAREAFRSLTIAVQEQLTYMYLCGDTGDLERNMRVANERAVRALAALSAPAPSIDWKRVEEVRARHEYAEQKGGDLYTAEYCEWTFSQTHTDRAFLLSLLPDALKGEVKP